MLVWKGFKSSTHWSSAVTHHIPLSSGGQRLPALWPERLFPRQIPWMTVRYYCELFTLCFMSLEEERHWKSKFFIQAPDILEAAPKLFHSSTPTATATCGVATPSLPTPVLQVDSPGNTYLVSSSSFVSSSIFNRTECYCQ